MDNSNKGRIGEQLFKQIMESRNYTVEDVSNNPDYWSQDIDFICTSPTTGLTRSFEVKWDFSLNYTKNLFIEYYCPHSKGGRGWFEFCKADYIAYGDAINETFYIIPREELKERIKDMKLRTGRTCDGTEGFLLPLGEIEDLVMYL